MQLQRVQVGTKAAVEKKATPKRFARRGWNEHPTPKNHPSHPAITWIKPKPCNKKDKPRNKQEK